MNNELNENTLNTIYDNFQREQLKMMNDLKNVNMLNSDQLIGINTVGSSLRNANYQIRSEPTNPRVNVGPWNASTIDSDSFRRPLEIGGCE